MLFKDMKLSANTLKALEALNFVTPTDVQEKTIPHVISGKEVMVRSQTGTGKTAAFGIGMIEQIAQDKGKKALILAPTRELALQIWKDLQSLAKFHSIPVHIVYGGENMDSQLSRISRGFDILVATPGRLLDHAGRKTVDLSKFNIIVLDEADRMLDMGFREDIDAILSNVSFKRQMMLFSATLGPEILEIAEQYMDEPMHIEIGQQEVVSSIEEERIELNRRDKFGMLMRILREKKGKKFLIFVETQVWVEVLGNKLQEKGIRAEYLHGGMRQAKRERIMQLFKEDKIDILVATDVAARGLHIKDIDYVINYDAARDDDTHLHRVGRTGRMGKEGNAITFVELDAPRRTSRTSRKMANEEDKRYRPTFSFG